MTEIMLHRHSEGPNQSLLFGSPLVRAGAAIAI
jgi:hypothetical protein